MRFAKRCLVECTSAAVICAAFPSSWAAAGTSHVAIGRYESLTSAQGNVTSVVGETLLLVGRVDSSQPYLRVVTLDPANGARKGSELNRSLPQGPCYPANPLKALYSRHFLPGYCLIVGAGVEIATLPIAVQATGTPVAGSWGCLAMPVNPASVGRPTAVTEITGSAFGDGRARLFVATDSGRVLEFSRSQQGSISLMGQHKLGNGMIISDLGAVPQYPGILLGVAAGHQLSGWRIGSSTPQLMFRLSHPQGSRVKAFRVFEPGDRVPGATDTYIHIAFCDGMSDRVFYSTLSTTLLGNWPLDVRTAVPAFVKPVGGLLSFTGSLLLLVGPQGAVHYKLGYLDGSSAPGCMVSVSDPSWQPCLPCPIVVTGDVDNSGAISASDLIRLVGFVFKGGVTPQPCRASGDVDCSGAINASDVISMVNYVFKGGKPPCNVCSLFSGTWSCP